MPKNNKKKNESEIKINFGLKEQLDENSVAKLKAIGNELKQEEIKQKEEKEKKLAEARRQQEKNKSFAELFEESNLDWRSYK